MYNEATGWVSQGDHTIYLVVWWSSEKVDQWAVGGTRCLVVGKSWQALDKIMSCETSPCNWLKKIPYVP
jgi:hypothetical protein